MSQNNTNNGFWLSNLFRRFVGSVTTTEDEKCTIDFNDLKDKYAIIPDRIPNGIRFIANIIVMSNELITRSHCYHFKSQEGVNYFMETEWRKMMTKNNRNIEFKLTNNPDQTQEYHFFDKDDNNFFGVIYSTRC